MDSALFLDPRITEAIRAARAAHKAQEAPTIHLADRLLPEYLVAVGPQGDLRRAAHWAAKRLGTLHPRLNDVARRLVAAAHRHLP